MVDQANRDGLTYAAKPQKPSLQQNSPIHNTRDSGQTKKITTSLVSQSNHRGIAEEGQEFDWQEKGDGRAPARKKMLCYTVRRLMRLRLEQAFCNVQEAAHQFQAEVCDLRSQGEKSYMTGLQLEEYQKQQQRQHIRKVFLSLQLRQGEQSTHNAFTIWKDHALLAKRLDRFHDIKSNIKEQQDQQQTQHHELQSKIEDLETELADKAQEFERNEIWLETKLKRISVYSNESKSRSKAIECRMKTLLKRHRMRFLAQSFNRLYEHRKLQKIQNLYRQDMRENQEEFVYVTWQERERQHQAIEYLERAKKHAEIVKRHRKFEKQLKMQEQGLLQEPQQQLTTGETQQVDARSTLNSEHGPPKSQFSFVTQKLSQPKTIPYERIHRTIVTLQQKFRKSMSERGSWLSHQDGYGDRDHNLTDDSRDECEQYHQRYSNNNENNIYEQRESAQILGSTGTAMWNNNNYGTAAKSRADFSSGNKKTGGYGFQQLLSNYQK